MCLGLIIFSRTNSSRLPGKALKPLGSHPLIGRVINSVKQFDGKVIVATSDREFDDSLAEVARNYGASVFRGDLTDVSNRAAQCCQKYDLTYFARINGDSPFVSMDLISEGFRRIRDHKVDFVSNLVRRSYPYGISLEVFSVKSYLENVAEFNQYHQEHVTSFFYENIHRFKYQNIESDITYPENLVLTVDDIDSYQIVKLMFEEDDRIQDKTLTEIVKINQLIINNR